MAEKFDFDAFVRDNTLGDSDEDTFEYAAKKKDKSSPPAAATALILTVIAAVLGFCCGSWFDFDGSQDDIGVATITETVTVTKTVEVEKKVPTLPVACKGALETMKQLEPYAEVVITNGGKVADILSRARMAITQNDHQALVKVGNENNQLSNQTTGASQKMIELLAKYETQYAECQKELGR